MKTTTAALLTILCGISIATAQPISIATGNWFGTRTDYRFDGPESYATKVSVRESGGAIEFEEKYSYQPEGPESDRAHRTVTTTLSPNRKIVVYQGDPTEYIDSQGNGKWWRQGKRRIVAKVERKNWIGTESAGTIEFIVRKRRITIRGRFKVTATGPHFAIVDPDFDISLRRTRR